MEKDDIPPLPEEESLDPATLNELKKIHYQARMDLLKLEYQHELEKARAELNDDLLQDQTSSAAFMDNEYKMAQAIHNAYLDVARAEAGKATERAEFIQKAAAAISTVYVAVIGLSFGTGQYVKPLPVQGVITTIFLGLAIFLSTAYVAYITKPNPEPGVHEARNFKELQLERLNVFIRWARSPVLRRIYLLQASVISLGIGIIFLPAAFLALDGRYIVIWIISGLALVFLLPFAITGIQRLISSISKGQKKTSARSGSGNGTTLQELIERLEELEVLTKKIDIH
jgi:hypothetical protein